MLGNASPTNGQLNAAYVAIYLFFLSFLVHAFYARAVVLRGFLVLSSVISSLLAYDAFSVLMSLSIDPTSVFFVTIAFADPVAERAHALEINHHSGAYLLLSAVLVVLAFLGVVPLKQTLVYLAYAVLFTFICTNALLSWAFPLSLGSGGLTHDYHSFPFLFTFLYILLASLITLRPSVPLSTGAGGSGDSAGALSLSYASTLCLISNLWPFIGVVYIVSMELHEDCLNGVVWTAILATSTVTICTRMKELSGDVQALKRTGTRHIRELQQRSSAETAISTLSCILCIFWTIASTAGAKHSNSDLLVPLACLLVLFTRRDVFIEGSHPGAVAGLLAALWWWASALHSVFMKGIGGVGIQGFHHQHSWFPDQDVSIWTNGTWWLPVVTVILMLIPAPGIVLGLRSRQGQSEEVMLVLGVLSALPVVLSSINSVRYLGLLGCVFSSMRFYNIGSAQRNSDRLI